MVTRNVSEGGVTSSSHLSAARLAETAVRQFSM